MDNNNETIVEGSSGEIALRHRRVWRLGYYRAHVRASRTRRRNWKATHVPRGRAGILPTRDPHIESRNDVPSRPPTDERALKYIYN